MLFFQYFFQKGEDIEYLTDDCLRKGMKLTKKKSKKASFFITIYFFSYQAWMHPPVSPSISDKHPYASTYSSKRDDEVFLMQDTTTV